MKTFAEDITQLAQRIVGTSPNSEHEMMLVSEGILFERQRCEKIARDRAEAYFEAGAKELLKDGGMKGEECLKIAALIANWPQS